MRDYTTDLQQHIDIPIVFQDEALSTKRAEASLHARGIHGKKLKQRIDAVVQALGVGSPKDMGRVMKVLMPKLQGRADGRTVNRLVRERLG